MEAKRKRPGTTKTAGKKGVKAPRRTQSQRTVIPGLLKTRGEEKKVLFTGTSLALNTTGTIAGINLIQVGSSMFNRIGRRIEMVSVRLTAFIFPMAVTRTNILDHGRILIVYDRQTNGAFPAMADILQDTDQAGVNSTSALSGLNMNNRERFVTILDHRFYIPQATDTASLYSAVFPNDTYHMLPVMNEYRRLMKLTTHYKADSNPAVIGDISTGGLYLVSLTSTSPAGQEVFSMTSNVRLKYVDV